MTDHHPECEDVTGEYAGSCTCAIIKRREAMEHVIHSSMPIDFERRYAMDNLIAQDADLIDVASKVTEADREVLIRISNSDDETAQRIHRGLIYTWEVGEIARHRLEERAKIVAWLRSQGEFGSERAQAWGETFAEQLEAGEHLK